MYMISNYMQPESATLGDNSEFQKKAKAEVQKALTLSEIISMNKMIATDLKYLHDKSLLKQSSFPDISDRTLQSPIIAPKSLVLDDIEMKPYTQGPEY